MSEKPARGGAREGAGRKARDTPRKAITVRLEPEDVARLRDLCKARGVSQADWITEKIRKFRR
jgi:predicted HicB family RNase H-like nuclease